MYLIRSTWRWLPTLAFLGLAGAPLLAHAAPAAAPAARAETPKEEVAVFAGGCFWCMETQFEGRPGVRSVTSGFAGGKTVNPSYDDVVRGGTGHYEAVEVRFDPTRISYQKLLDIFWHSIDPTQSDGQFCDRGPSYRSAIFPRDSAQRRLAHDSKRRIERSGVLKRPIATAILPGGPFYPAEDYHQDFWKKDPVRYQSYRLGCGRDRRVEQVWGKLAEKPSVH